MQDLRESFLEKKKNRNRGAEERDTFILLLRLSNKNFPKGNLYL